MSLLEITDLNMCFGGIQALSHVNFKVAPNSITALIGPNGAGKTTLFNCVTGFYRATKGTLVFNGAHEPLDILMQLGPALTLSDVYHPIRLAQKFYYKAFGGSHRLVRAGIARTFQNIRLFQEMSVLENLLVARHHFMNKNILSGVLQTKDFKAKRQANIDLAYHWLEVFDLTEVANQIAGNLSYGAQRRLEMARAMCTEPTLLCLDEPAAGLNPNETQALSKTIQSLRDEHNVTVLIIEHDMSLVMDISDHIIVLDHGQVIATGAPESIKNNEAVIAAYLGVEA